MLLSTGQARGRCLPAGAGAGAGACRGGSGGSRPSACSRGVRSSVMCCPGAGMVVHRHAGLAVLRAGYESLRRLCPWDATTQAADAESRSQVETPDGSLRSRVPRGDTGGRCRGSSRRCCGSSRSAAVKEPTPTWPGSHARVSVSRETRRDECAGRRFSRWTSFTVAGDRREVHAGGWMPAVISLHGCTRCQRSTDPRLRVAPEGSGEPPVVTSDTRPGPGERVAAPAGAATPRSVGPRTDRAALAIDAVGSGQRRGLGRGRPGYGGTFRPREGCVRVACSRVRARGRAGAPRTRRDVDAGMLVAWAQAGCPGGRGRAAESAPRRGRYRCLEDAAACGVPSSCAAQRRAGRPRADAGVVHSSQESCGQLSPSS